MAAGSARRWRSGAPEGALTVGEVAFLAVAWLLCLVVGTSLALAEFGVHRGWLAVVLGVVPGAALVAFAWRRSAQRCRFDALELVIGGALVLLTAFLVFPGFHYGAKNKDPGVYVGHALAIEREHDTSFPNPALDIEEPFRLVASEPVVTTDAGDINLQCCGSYLAMRPDPEAIDRIVPSFFHAWPALLATATGVAGRFGLFNTGPAFAVLSVLGVFLAVRRATGALAGSLGAGLLAVGMMQVWQARYPTSEVATQFFFVAAVVGVAVGVALRFAPALVVTGAAVMATFLLRADGLLLVGLVLAAAAGLLAFQRGEWAARPLLLGSAVLAPLALYQAYDRTARYTEGKIPSFLLVAAGVLVLAVGAIVVRWWRRGHPGVDRGIDGLSVDRTMRILAVTAAVALGLVFVFAALRPELLGEAMGRGRSGEVVRKYDEENLRRLTWFLTPAVFPLAVAGVGLAVARRPRGVLWGLLVPGLLLTPLYLWEPRIAPMLMWWTRRYVPVVLVFLLVTAAVAVAWLFTRRGWWRIPATVVALAATLWIGVTGLTQSLELHDHDEWGGSMEVIDDLAELSTPEQSVFVWVEPDEGMRNLVATLTTHHGYASVAVESVDADVVDALAALYPDRELLFVGRQPRLLDASLEPSTVVRGEVERWEETFDSRPDEARQEAVELWVARRPAG